MSLSNYATLYFDKGSSNFRYVAPQHTFQHLLANGTLQDVFSIQNGTIIQSGQTVTAWPKNNTNIYYTSGNVGIGTSTPLYTLDLNGTANFRSNVTINGTLTASLIDGFQYPTPDRYTELLTTSKSVFTVTVSGIHVFTENNVDVFVNGLKLGYISVSQNDYTISSSQGASSTTVTVTLNQSASVNDVVEIAVHKPIVTNSNTSGSSSSSVPTATAVTINTNSNVEGVSSSYARADHTHALTSTTPNANDYLRWNGTNWVPEQMFYRIQGAVCAKPGDTLYTSIGIAVGQVGTATGYTTASEIPLLQLTTATSANAIATWGVGTINQLNRLSISRFTSTIKYITSQGTGFRHYIGLIANNAAGDIGAYANGSSTPPMYAFRYFEGNDTTWKVMVTKTNGTVPTLYDTGVSLTTNTLYRFVIYSYPTKVEFFINNALVLTLTNSSLPATTQGCALWNLLSNGSSGQAKSMYIGDLILQQ